jgi:hypothetical protein
MRTTARKALFELFERAAHGGMKAAILIPAANCSGVTW